ncbi:hypothetical protein IAR55_006329 [Kwoniella newhampshirensis]|uniref:Zn(2)-C6 fungal-type domain-containing protein n=1 Tax=Kwoniella newhampshirensis TaxID=1651941 RepID=A0AAW0YY26_9TREE
MSEGDTHLTHRRAESSHSDTDEEFTSTKKKIRRHRAKLTCLACQRRKTKCDKIQPCSPCATRGESETCLFEPGVLPLDPSPGSQVAQLGRATHSHLAPTSSSASRSGSPSSKGPVPLVHSDNRNVRAALQEKIFGDVERIAESSGLDEDAHHDSAQLHQAAKSTKGNDEIWPNIVSTSNVRRTPKWERDMKHLCDTLPTKEQIECLVDIYFTEVQILRLIVHEGVFRTELAQFEALRSLGMQMSTDPAWIAQLASVLWVTMYLLLDERPVSEPRSSLGLVPPLLEQMASDAFEAVETALTCAQWLIHPQFRVLQTLLIVATLEINCQGPYYSTVRNGSHGDWTRSMHFDIAVGIAKQLQLHVVTSLQAVFRLQDPALPTSRPMYSLQMASRAFHTVLFLDTSAVCMGAGPNDSSPTALFCFPEGSFSTPEPENYPEETLLSDNPVRSRDAWEKTQFIWEYHMNQVARFWRIVVLLVQRTEDLSYETILAQSQALRESYHHFLTMRTTCDPSPIESDAFYLLNSAYLHRFLRLHRPFLLRSYRDARYLESQITVVSAARQIIQSHRHQICAKVSRLLVRNAAYPYIHHLSSLLVLFLHALLDEQSRSDVRKNMVKSQEAFEKVGYEGKKFHRVLAGKGYRLVTEMIKVIEDPPSDIENIEDIVRDLQRRAVQNRPVLQNQDQTYGSASASTSGDVTLNMFSGSENDTVSDSLLGDGGSYMDVLGPGNMPIEAWDIDWDMFIRDL